MTNSTLQIATVQHRNGQHRFRFRANSAADHGVLEQVFRQRDYDFSMLKQNAAVERWLKENPAPLIIDAGANIGASAVWFALNYPQAQIVAVEPEKENYNLLVLNTLPLNVNPIQAAVGPEYGMGVVHDPGRGEWGFQVRRSDANPDGQGVVITTITDLVNRAQEQSRCAPFLCKVDIEGGEDELFSMCVEWLEDFPVIAIEVHDWMEPGRALSRNFLYALSRYDFDVCIRGENLFCFNNGLLQQ